MFRGTIDGAQVHVREVVKAALRHKCRAVVLSTITRPVSPSPARRTRRSPPAARGAPLVEVLGARSLRGR